MSCDTGRPRKDSSSKRTKHSRSHRKTTRLAQHSRVVRHPDREEGGRAQMPYSCHPLDGPHMFTRRMTLGAPGVLTEGWPRPGTPRSRRRLRRARLGSTGAGRTRPQGTAAGHRKACRASQAATLVSTEEAGGSGRGRDQAGQTNPRARPAEQSN